MISFVPAGLSIFRALNPALKHARVVLGYYQNANGQVNKLEISKTGNKYRRRFYNRRYEAKGTETLFGAWKKLWVCRLDFEE